MGSQSVAQVSVGGQDGRRWWALGLIVAAQFMVVLDVAIVNVALPSIRTDLGFSQESLQWVITAYAIFFGGFLLLGGRLADLLGRRRLFIAGLAIFTAASLLNGLAWSEASLIFFRSVQGTRRRDALPSRALDLDRRHSAKDASATSRSACGGAASEAAAPRGVLLGGALTSALSWSWIFFINVPAGLLVMAWPGAAARAAPISATGGSTSPGRLDHLGADALVYAMTGPRSTVGRPARRSGCLRPRSG